MPGKDMSSIKNVPQYEALKKQGMSKERAAKISNASTAKSSHKHNVKYAQRRGYGKR